MTAHFHVTLADKRKEIEAYIGSLEQDLEQARIPTSPYLANRIG